MLLFNDPLSQQDDYRWLVLAELFSPFECIRM